MRGAGATVPPVPEHRAHHLPPRRARRARLHPRRRALPPLPPPPPPLPPCPPPRAQAPRRPPRRRCRRGARHRPAVVRRPAAQHASLPLPGGRRGLRGGAGRAEGLRSRLRGAHRPRARRAAQHRRALQPVLPCGRVRRHCQHCQNCQHLTTAVSRRAGGRPCRPPLPGQPAEESLLRQRRRAAAVRAAAAATVHGPPRALPRPGGVAVRAVPVGREREWREPTVP